MIPIQNDLNLIQNNQENVQLDSVSAVPFEKASSSKKWFIVAIVIGSLVVIGVGGFGTVGLLQSHGIILLPQSLQWLTSAIGTIGHTPYFCSLWILGAGGLTVGTSLIALGIYGVKKKALADSQNLDDIPQSNDRAHRITWALQSPLNFGIRTAISIIYPLQGSAGQKFCEVVKRICKFIAVILLFIPQGLLYGLGTISSRISNTPRIDTSMLHVAPPPLELPNKNLSHSLVVLQQWFQEEGLNTYQTEFDRMITNIMTKNQALIEAHAHLPTSFYNDMTLYLTNIIDLLERYPQRKKGVLNALAEAANVCPPTWYEVTKKQLQLLVNPNVGEVQLLHWIQEIKEEIILDLAQNTFDTQWHALNYARYHVGVELGLNMEGLQNDQYFPRTVDSGFTKEFMIMLFKAHFKTDNLITALQIKINESYQVYFFDMLKEAITARGVKDPVDYVAENFYDEDSIMKRNGVIMLLKIFGYVN